MTAISTIEATALANYTAGLNSLVAAVATVPSDPSDAVRILVTLVSYQPTAVISAARASAALCRRLALVQLCSIVPTISYTSFDDVEQAVVLVTGLLDTEIEYAGDNYEDGVIGQLRDLLAQVVASLTAQGANLAPLVDRSFHQSFPARVVAQMLYSTGGRGDEIVARTDAPHPSFQPVTMRVLSR